MTANWRVEAVQDAPRAQLRGNMQGCDERSYVTDIVIVIIIMTLQHLVR